MPHHLGPFTCTVPDIPRASSRSPSAIRGRYPSSGTFGTKCSISPPITIVLGHSTTLLLSWTVFVWGVGLFSFGKLDQYRLGTANINVRATPTFPIVPSSWRFISMRPLARSPKKGMASMMSFCVAAPASCWSKRVSGTPCSHAGRQHRLHAHLDRSGFRRMTPCRDRNGQTAVCPHSSMVPSAYRGTLRIQSCSR